MTPCSLDADVSDRQVIKYNRDRNMKNENILYTAEYIL
jgi:hypothetical protein